MKNNKVKSAEEYYQEVLKVMEARSVSENPLLQKDGTLQSSVLSLVMNKFPSMIFVIDLYKHGYTFVSDNVFEISGIDPQEFLTGGLKRAIQQFPAAHNEIITQHIFPTMFQFFGKHCFTGDFHDITVTYPTHIIHQDGTKRWYLHTVKGLSMDNTKRPHLLLKMLSDIDDIKKDEHLDFLIIKSKNGKTETLHRETFYPKIQNGALSTRETEILDLISNGFTNAQIAEKLFISLNTVQTHRKNILKKMECKGTAELTKLAFKREA